MRRFHDLFVDRNRQRVYVSCGEGYLDVFEVRSAAYERIAHLATMTSAWPMDDPSGMHCSTIPITRTGSSRGKEYESVSAEVRLHTEKLFESFKLSFNFDAASAARPRASAIGSGVGPVASNSEALLS
jgi:hypothetical protein